VVENLRTDKRTTERRAVSLPARLTWKDARGTMRFASGIARNVSELGVYIECPTPVSIPCIASCRSRSNATACRRPPFLRR
jgi:hypothetical protein